MSLVVTVELTYTVLYLLTIHNCHGLIPEIFETFGDAKPSPRTLCLCITYYYLCNCNQVILVYSPFFCILVSRSLTTSDKNIIYSNSLRF
ncbi:hypothetical protein V1509DRAFT_616567 [Lipomyces kononenkoae]